MRNIIQTDKAPQAIGPYSQAVETAGTVYISGQIPLDPATGEMAGTIEEQTDQVMRNLSAILEEAGLSFDQVVKTTIFLTSLDDFAAVNEVYGRHLSEPYPARATVEISKLPKGAKVEIEAIAVRSFNM
ncbi:2-iminobutanoate/2-iminopropanoate deaminase [Terribacillus halophilus]|uniref:2-iminobutanoate/2-iminopropanoate deaminase n=1 Tax=Terribacillus halophilus TaxID=361279 RepID=A0A1G6HY94_9BACI|nr:RidA family protein [Terribacillus halophilus]SDB99191.1 2-iminobutanoate/2-iminopropanoate deaminase [Terribacillus halophilus]